MPVLIRGTWCPSSLLEVIDKDGFLEVCAVSNSTCSHFDSVYSKSPLMIPEKIHRLLNASPVIQTGESKKEKCESLFHRLVNFQPTQN